MRFEDLFTRPTCFCSWGRTALYLALSAVDVCGREVLLPAFTCATNVPPAVYAAGGKPVFVEVDPHTLGLSLADLQEKINKHTAAIISHAYYGFVPESVAEVQKLAREHRIPHILDNAHAWGTDEEGDITVYSFTKSFTLPAGGAVMFRDERLFMRAVSFQEGQARVAHGLVTDVAAYSYQRALAEDRKEAFRGILPHALLRRVMAKFVKLSKFYRFPDFYGMELRHQLFDTRMTEWQHKQIACGMVDQEERFARRRRLGLALDAVFPTINRRSSFPVYPCMVKDIEPMERFMASLSVRTRRVWPAFQRYAEAQVTVAVRTLRDHLLLLDTDDFTMEKIRRLG